MWWCVALMLAGCNQLLGLDETAPLTADAPIDGPGCSSARFVNAMRLQGSALATDWDPSSTQDMHELWVTRSNDPNGFDLFILTETGGTYDTATAFTDNSAASDGDPALSADGLALAFISERLSGIRVFEATRTSTSVAFEPSSPVASIPAAERGIDLSRDGLRLYYVSGDPPELRVVERPDRSSAFGPPGPVLATDVHYPSISADELELFHARYNSGSIVGVFRLTRTTTTVPFEPDPEAVAPLAADPDISPDSTRLYFTTGGELGSMTRTCN